MALKRKVLIKNVNNLSDARYCAGMGVQILGFSLDEKSDNHIPVADIREIRDWVEGIEVAIQVVSSPLERISTAISELNPEYLIVNPERLDEIKDSGIKILIEGRGLQEVLEQINQKSEIEFFGTIISIGSQEFYQLESVILDKLNSLSPLPVFLEVADLESKLEFIEGLDENVGLVLSGGKEIRPGFKDFYELSPVLEYLENDQ